MATKSIKSAAALKPYKEFPSRPTGGESVVQKAPGADDYFWHPRQLAGRAKRFEQEWPYIVQGLTPPALADDTDASRCGRCAIYLESKTEQADAGELTEIVTATASALQKNDCPFRQTGRVDDLRPLLTSRRSGRRSPKE